MKIIPPFKKFLGNHRVSRLGHAQTQEAHRVSVDSESAALSVHNSATFDDGRDTRFWFAIVCAQM